MLRPDITALSDAGFAFQLHTLIGMALFAIWPFTRLVHAFTVPVGYLFPAVRGLPVAYGRTRHPPREARL